MSNDFDVHFGDKDLTTGFTQLKPQGEGRSIIVSFIGKMKQSGYHWLPGSGKGYRCNGDGCPACAAGVTQSWSAVALAAAYRGDGSIQVGYVPLSRSAYRTVSGLNGGKPKECDVKVTSLSGGYAFQANEGKPPHWKTNGTMRRAVEAAESSKEMERLLESKLYEQITNEEWHRVLSGKSLKELEPED